MLHFLTFFFKSKMAGHEWFCCFLKRHPDLSIHTFEASSLNRAIGFKMSQLKIFYDVPRNNKSTESRIF